MKYQKLSPEEKMKIREYILKVWYKHKAVKKIQRLVKRRFGVEISHIAINKILRDKNNFKNLYSNKRIYVEVRDMAEMLKILGIWVATKQVEPFDFTAEEIQVLRRGKMLSLNQMIESEYFKHKIKSALKYKSKGLPNYKIAQKTDLPLEIINELEERQIYDFEDLGVLKK